MIAAPVRTVVELLRFEPQSHRTLALIRALGRGAAAAHITLAVTDRFHGGASWLVLWGPGAPDRIEPMRRQLAAGGHVVCFDLAYWQRDDKVRVSIDAPHPQAWVMRRAWPAQRFVADRVPVTNAWNPGGPVIVAGIGEKATVQYGADVRSWETAMIGVARDRGLDVRYRPKKNGAVPVGLRHAGAGPIETILKGASLVITWHSNVAIDAIRMGIPVICRDGAAAAVCDSTWTDEPPTPLPGPIRDRFLANLAWFQWNPATEAVACWTFLKALLA